jgi:regulator of protease activity HflC (stomatin/prohibitin superfamily)
MENAFAWVRYIMEWLGQFIPRWEIVSTTHGWVKFVRGTNVSTGGAGIVWYWPATTNILTYPVVRQTTPLPSQVITTRDRQTVTLCGMVVYEVFDLEKLLAHTYDPDDTIKDIAASALTDVCCKLTWEEIQSGQGRTLDTKLKNAARNELEDYGVRVLKFTLTTLAATKVYRLIQSSFQEGEVR